MPVSQFYIENKRMPFVRLLSALIFGILLQWHLHLSLLIVIVIFAVSVMSYLFFPLLKTYKKFQWQWLQGACVLAMLIACGSLLCYLKNPFHQPGNYTRIYKDGDAVIATVNEALVSKPKTYKANATVNAIYQDKKYIPVTGTIIIYFDKNNLDSTLQYGSRILLTQTLQAIKNPGNPGGFDYQRYLLFQGITAQVYIKSSQYKIVSNNKGSSFKAYILRLQNYINPSC